MSTSYPQCRVTLTDDSEFCLEPGEYAELRNHLSLMTVTGGTWWEATDVDGDDVMFNTSSIFTLEYLRSAPKSEAAEGGQTPMPEAAPNGKPNQSKQREES